MGWLEGCKRIIGFDGCFLKGMCKGELLVAVGKNGNNQIFPIAWVVVETKHSWTWFIQHLSADLELGDGFNLTVTSDSQKGLIPAIENLQCKDEFARLGMLGRNICEYVLDYNKEVWVRAYFSPMSKCDVVKNNMCEAFHSWIVVPRHKSVITILEEIRHKVMTRTVDMRRFAETLITDISPIARMNLEENKDAFRRCKVLWNGDNGFEISNSDIRHIVDLREKTCTCRTWMLRGIPCPHAICSLYHLGQNPDGLVEH
uniref:SWIM-type domain-containing protein n=1 Tax=Nicotiana tabacum TaxID=4097 RepID=A0A1S4B491_TOBAC|nr:PREDICTED: uncharacterized protein LOC107804376 [Nicotiana tabacum]